MEQLSLFPAALRVGAYIEDTGGGLHGMSFRWA